MQFTVATSSQLLQEDVQVHFDFFRLKHLRGTKRLQLTKQRTCPARLQVKKHKTSLAVLVLTHFQVNTPQLRRSRRLDTS